MIILNFAKKYAQQEVCPDFFFLIGQKIFWDQTRSNPRPREEAFSKCHFKKKKKNQNGLIKMCFS